MADLPLLKSTLAGSLYFLSEEERLVYLKKIFLLPSTLQAMAFSDRVAAYIRGLVRQFSMAIEAAPVVARLILGVLLGEFVLSELAQKLSAQLQIPLEQAQAMAKDIEKELFGPVMVELNQYLQSKQSGGQQAASPPPPPVVGPNLLDLRGRASGPPNSVS